MLPFEISYSKKAKVNPKRFKNELEHTQIRDFYREGIFGVRFFKDGQVADKPGRIDTLVIKEGICPLVITYKRTDEKDPPVKADHFIGYCY